MNYPSQQQYYAPVQDAELAQHSASHLIPPPGALQQRQVGKRRSAWGVWWLSGLTLGIYYMVWYYKINDELRRFAPERIVVSPGLAMGAQFLPIFAWVSLAHTSARLNNALHLIGSPVRTTGAMTILSTFWFSSHTRYLQRRLNSLWDAYDTAHANRGRIQY